MLMTGSPTSPVDTDLRVAFYCNLMGWPKRSGGGVRQWVLALANGLVARGHAVDVLTEAPQKHFVDEPLLDPRVRRIVLGRRGWFAAQRLQRYVLDHPGVRLVSALNDFNFVAAQLKVRMGARTHVTVTQHENLTGEGSWRKNFNYWRITRGVRSTFNLADAVIGVSRGVVEDLRDRFGVREDLLHAIYNPAFSENLLEEARAPVEHPWLRDKTHPVLLAVGRLHPVKGFDDLIAAFSRLRRHVDARLIILGEGRVRGQLEEQVRKLGLSEVVALPGRQASVAPWMARADLFVLSSRAEGFGNALIEAMACGMRVVATRCPNGPSEILEDGRWGRMVPVGDHAALADAIQQELAAPPPDRAALLGRARAFSLDQSLDRYLEIWRKPPR